jgi:NADPH-dependent 2,4-dienoyl-CoA reductase/sulfur reductase-like enzyme
MSNEVLVAARDLESITVNRRRMGRAGVHVIRDRATGIDVSAHQVTLNSGRVVGFDRLVLAPGIRFLNEKIEGYDEFTSERMPHAWRAGEQTQRLAAQLQHMEQGGIVAISVPSGLYRCPPAPYERASLMVHYLSQRNPRAKILIFDSNNHFPKQDLFTATWQELYPGMIEWIAPDQGGGLLRVDSAAMTLHTSSGSHHVSVANVIPPQAPGQLAADTGLSQGHGWCPIEPLSFQSTLHSDVHVIGDACIADDMPKSASAAVSQAHQCASAIAAIFSGRKVPAPTFDSVCYSALAPDRAIRMPGRFELREGRIASLGAAADQAPVGEAEHWYRQIRERAFAE